MAEKLAERTTEKPADRRETAQGDAGLQSRSLLGLPSQQSIDLLTRLLKEFERRSASGSTVPPEVERDVAFVNAAFDSVKSALALAERPIVVAGIVPGGGPTSGGTAVTITGSHFLAGARVRFGKEEARDVVHISLNEIRATTPAVLTPGTVDILVDSLAGSARLPNGFTYSNSDLD